MEAILKAIDKLERCCDERSKVCGTVAHPSLLIIDILGPILFISLPRIPPNFCIEIMFYKHLQHVHLILNPFCLRKQNARY